MYDSVIRQAENDLDLGLHFLEYGISLTFSFWRHNFTNVCQIKSEQRPHLSSFLWFEMWFLLYMYLVYDHQSLPTTVLKFAAIYSKTGLFDVSDELQVDFWDVFSLLIREAK